ncbi:MAG TPA: hypothetical protein VF069_13860 [Streptosporangiaceae bacterium]
MAADDEWRVEIELDDAKHGFSLMERFRAFDLDDDVRRRLGDRVIVTRDGSRVFLYARSENDAREAGQVADGLVKEHRLTAEITITRWHPAAQEWKDISVPLPASPEDVVREEAERRPIAPGLPDPRFVYMEAYKPEFLRDLGL